MRPGQFRPAQPGIEALPPSAVPRHFHRSGYATVVLAGVIREFAFAGCAVAEPGDVLLHGPFDAHQSECLSARGPEILRLPWVGSMEGRFRLNDPDRIARLAEVDPVEAAAELGSSLQPHRAEELHWTDKLAIDLLLEGPLDLRTWAECHRLRQESVSRGFKRRFGTSPQRFRLEARARRAWRLLVGTPASATQIAHETGFADLAHLSRSIAALTGAPPRHWRRKA
jgi:AraC-like DNA-binding protein